MYFTTVQKNAGVVERHTVPARAAEAARMITQELEDNINFTHTDARRRGLEAITVEHLVLVMIDNSSVRQCLSLCRADIDSLRQDLEHYLESSVARAAGNSPMPTVGFQRVLKRAVSHLRGRTKVKASGVHVLAAVFAEPNSHAAYFLKKHGVERLAVLAYANEQTEKAPPTEAQPAPGNELVALAAAGKIEEPFGRLTEVAEVARVLSRKYKNNPLLVGEAGVGKTAVAHKLAHCAAAGLPSLAGMKLFSVAIGELIAGTKYRGDFEQRLRQLIEKCRAYDNAVVFIDEIHTLVGAGAVAGGSLDAANILKPILGGNGGLRCLGATTFTEYRRIFEKDAALSRRFQKVVINEPADDELQEILSGVIARLTVHHGVSYAPTAAAAAASCARRFLPSRFLPDSAIDLLDDAGAGCRAAQKNAPIDEDMLAATAARAAGLPARAADTGRQMANLAAQLSARVIAQPEAAQRLAAAVRRLRLGYHEGARAAGAFLFAGPTGVGKTAMARSLADVLGTPLLRFDMSECMEAHAVSRLIGAPPGYVGFEQSGRLVEDIARHPNAVVLLDEIEKAHPEVLNILLQIMDYGVLTDNIGRRADFSGAILVMTTNAGAEQWEREPVGFARDDAAQAGSEELSRRLTPEFRNRLDAVVRFLPLEAKALSRILSLRLRELTARLRAEKNIRIKIGRHLRAQLLADGFSPTMGARPLERLLREYVMDALAAAEADGNVVGGGHYHLEMDQQNRQTEVKMVH